MKESPGPWPKGEAKGGGCFGLSGEGNWDQLGMIFGRPKRVGHNLDLTFWKEPLLGAFLGGAKREAKRFLCGRGPP